MSFTAKSRISHSTVDGFSSDSEMIWRLLSGSSIFLLSGDSSCILRWARLRSGYLGVALLIGKQLSKIVNPKARQNGWEGIES